MSLWRLSRGDSPLVIDVPHAGTVVPEAIAARMTANAITLPDTDWHVEKLYAFAAEAGATLLFATHSRYVVDLNRDPAGVALYAGADNTELVPTRSFDNAPIWREGAIPGPDEVAARVDRYFTPYHEALHAEIDRVRARHGHAVVLDGHSIRATVPRFFAGRLPDFNLGTADGASADPSLESLAARLLGEDRAFSSVVNGRFKGGWITRHYGRPAENVHAVQMELACRAYMAEEAPFAYDAAKAPAIRMILLAILMRMQWWAGNAT